ncbi:MAG: HTH domain-containing protein, partial [Coprobacillus sp.]
MEKKRIIQIIKILSKYNEPISGPDLCNQLDISVKTLRSDLKSYREELYQYGIEIKSKHAVGYEMYIIDEKKYYHFIENAMKEEADQQMLIPIYPEERIN